MKHSRTARATFALMLSMMVSVWLAPAAHAQLGGGIGDAVGGIGDAVGGGTGDGSGGGGIVGDITGGLEGGSSDSGSDGGTPEEGGGGLVGGITDKIKETVDSGKDTVDEVTEDTTETVGNVGGGLVGTIDETVDKVKQDLTGTGTKKQRNSTRPEGRRDTSSPSNTADVLAHTYAGALEADGKALSVAIAEGKSFTAEPNAATSDQSLVSQIGRIATEAARQVAFPLALTLLVIGFLMVQNRIDRKDPKLALAPVDSEHDLLSFT